MNKNTSRRFTVGLVYEEHGNCHAEIRDPKDKYYTTIITGYSQCWRAKKAAQKVVDQLNKGYGAIDI